MDMSSTKETLRKLREPIARGLVAAANSECVRERRAVSLLYMGIAYDNGWTSKLMCQRLPGPAPFTTSAKEC